MRSRLLLPVETVSFHLSIHKQITPARDLSAASEGRQAEFWSVFWSSLPLSVLLHPLLFAPLPSPPSSLSLHPTHSYSNYSRAEPLTLSPLCECVRKVVSMCVLVRMSALLFTLRAVFKSGGQTFLFRVWERERERRPPWCCDLTKQTAGLRAVPPPVDSGDSRD